MVDVVTQRTTEHTQLEVLDGQLHEMGPRLRAIVGDEELRRRIMLEVTVSAMDAVGVSGAVLHPSDPGFGKAARAEFPERFVWVRTVSQADSSDGADVVNSAAESGAVGVRIVAGARADGGGQERLEHFRAGGFDSVFAQAQAISMPVLLFISGDLPLVPVICARYPDLVLVIDHVGLRQPPADERDRPPFRRLDEVVALAKYTHVLIKICGLAALSERSYPYDDVWRPVRRLIDEFGADRLLWASDASRFQRRTGWSWPERTYRFPDVGEHSYAQAVSMMVSSSELNMEEKRLIMGANARRVFDW